MWRFSRGWVFLFWILCLVQIVTITSSTPFVFAGPGSPEQLVILLAYLVSSLCWLERFRKLPFVLLHLFVVLCLLVSHPLTLYFGRDGAVIVIGVYFLLALHHLTSIPGRYQLLVGSLFVSALLVELLLSTVDESGSRSREGLKDYGDLMGSYGEGGFLLPELDLMVVGEHGEARFITNRFGFRNQADFDYAPSAGFRVLLIGDSFVAGYRTDQDETMGRVLERELSRTDGYRDSEVLIAGAGHPGAYYEYLRDQASKFHPNLILVGITLGNDISQSYAARRGADFEKEVNARSFLPADAYKRSYLERLPVKIDRSLRTWRAYRFLTRMIRTEPIGSWLGDHPTDVHSFDAIHSLGHFYDRQPISVVEESYLALFYYLGAIDSWSLRNETPVVFLLLPQRFQVAERDWKATVFAYALDEPAFDLEKPNRRIMDWCRGRVVSCLNLLPVFKESTDSLYLPRGDMHWNAMGQRLAALTVKEYLLEQGRSVMNPTR
ncbi:MAG: hypothetical protein ACRD1X_19610 [Vicinamibacteria bacterium]